MAIAAQNSLGFDAEGNPLPPLRLSNHSYGPSSYGWTFGFAQGLGSIAIWNADPTAYPAGTPISQVREDWQFGFYTERSQSIDNIVSANFRFLLVYSAGNERSGNSGSFYSSLPGYPAPPTGRAYVFVRTSPSAIELKLRSITLPNIYPEPLFPPTDGDEDGDFFLDEDGDQETDLYDTLGDYAVAKNNLVVTSVADLPSGWVPGLGYNTVSDFASFGPPDDGRVKRDLAANGEDVLSSTIYLSSPVDVESNYEPLPGTSMAAPGVTGSLGLILQLWRHSLSGGENQAFALPPPNFSTHGVAIPVGSEIGPQAHYANYEWSAPQVDSRGYRYASHFGSPEDRSFGYRLDPSAISYIPFRLPHESGWTYGWLRLLQPNLTYSVYIDAWAYELTPNQPIIAGAIPEPAMWPLLVLGGGLVAWLVRSLSPRP